MVSLSGVQQAKVLWVGDAGAAEARRAVEELGCRCLTAASAEEAEALLRREPFALLIARIHDKTADFRLFDLARRLRPECRGIAVIGESLEEYLPELVPRSYPLHFLADNAPLDLRELAATVRKLLSGDIFGIDKYGVDPISELVLKSSRDKYPAIERARDFYRGRGVSERIVRNIELILNELLMNALFDAPVDAAGNRPFSRRDRTEGFEIPEGARPGLTFGMGDSALALAVSDCYGSLSAETFFSYIHRCVTEKSVLEGPGQGAGMGLFLVFKSLDKMIVNVAPGRKTEVIALLDHRTPLGELKRRRHSFHYFSTKDSGSGHARIPS